MTTESSPIYLNFQSALGCSSYIWIYEFYEFCMVFILQLLNFCEFDINIGNTAYYFFWWLDLSTALVAKTPNTFWP